MDAARSRTNPNKKKASPNNGCSSYPRVLLCRRVRVGRNTSLDDSRRSLNSPVFVWVCVSVSRIVSDVRWQNPIPIAFACLIDSLEVESIAGNVRILIKLERVLVGRRSKVFENGFVNIIRKELLDDVIRELVDFNIFVILQNFNL